jgi:Tol biopolymer transport system component
VGSAVVAALISVVGLATGPKPGVLVWTGTPAHLGAARTVPGATSPVPSPDGKRVAYVLSGELRVQAVGGGPVRTLTQVPGKDPTLAWSPDGARIAFPSEFSIVLLPAVGKGPVRLVRLPKAWEDSTLAALEWSPDGSKLAFSRTSGDGKKNTLRNELDVIGVDGKGARTLHLNPDPYGTRAEPSWSPDGKRIAFRLDEFRLATVSVAGGARVPLTNPPRGAVDGDPIWSPDGQWIAFARSPSRGVSDVWLAHPDGTGLRRLTTTPIPLAGVAHVGSSPLAWSPDGTQLLAFRHDRFAVVEVASRASRDLKRVGLQYSLLGARWR